MPFRMTAPIVLFASLMATATGWYLVSEAVTQRETTRFNAKTLAAVRAIERQVARYDAALYGVRGLFESSEEVTEDEFRVYVETTGLTKKYPGLSGVGYAVLEDGTKALSMSKLFMARAGAGRQPGNDTFLLDDPARA